MDGRESLVAAEIVRIAREELRLAREPAPGEPLAARLDSLEILALVVAVEDRFRVVLGEEDAARARTLEDLARIVASRTEAPLEAGAGDLP